MSSIRLGWDVVLILALAFVSGTLQARNKKVVIQAYEGQVIGKRTHFDGEIDISTFFGIPYAAPPVGDLRFKKTESILCGWGDKSPIDGTSKRPSCPQLDYHMPDLIRNEDCLYLNIYAPSKREEKIDHTLKPVIVYIHGVGFTKDQSAFYDFKKLASKGVVIVTVNYRLGPLGFLSTNDTELPGNYGLWDVIEALEWVIMDISYFGGDKDRITLYGFSSGASMVSMLTLSPQTRDKFKRAIMQSGSSITEFAMRDTSSASKQLIEHLNCSQPTTRLACLRNKTDKEILGGMKELYADDDNFLFNSYTPVVDGEKGVLPDTPLVLLQDKSSRVPKPTLRGFTRDEANEYFTESNISPQLVISKGLRYLFGDEKYRRVYNLVDAKYRFSSLIERLYEILVKKKKKPKAEAESVAVTDALFLYPTIREAILYSRKNEMTLAPTYLYRVDRPPQYRKPPQYKSSSQTSFVQHGDDLGYFLNLPKQFTNANGKDKRLADFVSTLITNFAKYGDPSPNPVNNVKWTPFISDNPKANSSACNRSPFEKGLDYKFLRLKKKSSMQPLSSSLQCDKIKFWTSIFEKE